jgi:hypothetical protein
MKLAEKLLAAEQIASAAPDERKFIQTEEGDALNVLSVSDRIRTIEDALKHGKIDTAVWYVDRSECTSWEGFYKTGQKGSEVAKVVPLWRIKITLKRRVSRSIETGSEELLRRIEKHSPKYPKLGKPKKITDGHLLEIGLYDVHFGKLAWRMETGQDYDLNIAERVYMEAGRRLIANSAGYPISRILMPIGNDFFHVDNLENKTTRGTPQDADGRYGKIFATGAMACVRMIEELCQIAPVDLLWVPGNHDAVASYHLVMFLEAWFRNCDRVTTDITKTLRTRKYYPFGPTVIGFTHSDKEKKKDLPAIMLHEARKMMATRRTLEIHTGHRHKEDMTIYTNTDTHAGGVIVRTLPSLSATDAWHAESGYVGSMRAAEAYLYSEVAGYVAHFSAPVQEDIITQPKRI